MNVPLMRMSRFVYSLDGGGAERALVNLAGVFIARCLPDAVGRLYGPVQRLGNALSVHPSRIMARHNVVARSRPPLRPEFERELTAVFAPQVESLSRLLCRDLSRWTGDGSEQLALVRVEA